MKCDTCLAYKKDGGIYVCVADVPDEEVKTFKDGSCGCKYKENTIKERMKKRGIAVEEQMNLLDFLNAPEDDARTAETTSTESASIELASAEPACVELASTESVSIDPEIIVSPKSKSPYTFRVGDRVQTAFSDEVYRVRAVSEDGRSIYVEGKTAGTQVMAAADLLRAM